MLNKIKKKLHIRKRMRLEKCYFCSSTVYPGHGITFFRNDCKVFKFCRSKCHRAFKKKRNPRKCRWTKSHRKATGKELAEDKVFEFEQKRNEPVKYSRDLWTNTVKAMERIEEIKQKRQNQFILNRLQVGTDNRYEADLKEIKDFMHLIKAPHGKCLFSSMWSLFLSLFKSCLCFSFKPRILSWSVCTRSRAIDWASSSWPSKVSSSCERPRGQTRNAPRSR